MPAEPPDFPYFTALCQIHTEEGNCPRQWAGGGGRRGVLGLAAQGFPAPCMLHNACTPRNANQMHTVRNRPSAKRLMDKGGLCDPLWMDHAPVAGVCRCEEVPQRNWAIQREVCESPGTQSDMQLSGTHPHVTCDPVGSP